MVTIDNCTDRNSLNHQLQLHSSITEIKIQTSAKKLIKTIRFPPTT